MKNGIVVVESLKNSILSAKLLEVNLGITFPSDFQRTMVSGIPLKCPKISNDLELDKCPRSQLKHGDDYPFPR